MAKQSSEFYNLVGNSDGKTLNLSINDDIGDFGTNAEDIASALNNKDLTQINIDINTRGGSVPQGIGIFNQLKNHPAHVTTNITGQAASIGSVIFAAGDKRTMDIGATMHTHPVRFRLMGTFLENDLRDLADEIPKLHKSVIDILHSVSNVSREEVENIIMKETVLTDQEALDMGFATDISTSTATNLNKYYEAQAINYKDDKEKIQQVLNDSNKILNNKSDKENVMEKKEFESKLAEFKSEFTNKIKTLETSLVDSSQMVNTYKEQVITLEGKIVDMNNKATTSEFTNFIDGLVSQGKVTPKEKEVEIQNLELRKDDAKMLDSYKSLLNSKPAKFSLSANFANNGGENVLDGKGATPEEEKKQKDLYAEVRSKRKGVNHG